ncbi:MAG: hypothetical protein ACREQB_05105 [Candidatus Binataceae bacterium]
MGLAMHKLGLRLGIVLLPNHYYTSVPDLNVLARSQEVWARRSTLRGVDVDLDGQARRVEEFCARFESEYSGNQT